METGLRRVCNDVSIGKLLIQTDPSTGEPQVLIFYGMGGVMVLRTCR